jgi:hypothetical protein
MICVLALSGGGGMWEQGQPYDLIKPKMAPGAMLLYSSMPHRDTSRIM